MEGSRKQRRPVMNRSPPFTGLHIRIPIIIPIMVRRSTNQGSTLTHSILLGTVWCPSPYAPLSLHALDTWPFILQFGSLILEVQELHPKALVKG